MKIPCEADEFRRVIKSIQMFLDNPNSDYKSVEIWDRDVKMWKKGWDSESMSYEKLCQKILETNSE